jgi:molybdopterin converting factor small subunit
VVEKSYRVRGGWRVLVNGRDINYSGGLNHPIQPGDTVSIFPPGR